MPRVAPALSALLALAGPAAAVDGVIEINQARAVTGNVTPGDTPGVPVTLSQPGSYRLTGDLTVPSFGTGIRILSSRVSIDLNGFSISGSNVCSGCPVSCTYSGGTLGAGISSEQDVSLITIRNGRVFGIPAFGIFLNSSQVRIEDVMASANGSNGVSIYQGVVSRTQSDGNGFVGIDFLDGGYVRESTARCNSTTGISGANNVLVTASTSERNGASGISVGSGSVVTSNVCRNNAQVGIFMNGNTIA